MKKIYIYVALFLGCATNIYAQQDNFAPNALSAGIQPGYGALTMKDSPIQSKGAISLGYGFAYLHRFSESLGISVGLNSRKYVGTLNMKDFADSVSGSDGNNPYYLHQKFESEEKYEINYLEIAAKIHYILPITESLDFNVGLGVAYGIPTLQRATMTGKYQRSMDFYEDHVTLDNVPDLTLGTYNDFIQTQEDGKDKAVDLFKPAISGVFEMGLQFYLSYQFTFNVKLTAAYGLTNLQKEAGNYLQLGSYRGIATSDKIQAKNLYAGLELGVTFHLWN